MKLLVHLQAIIGGDRLEVILNHVTIASQIGHAEVKSVSFGDKNTPHGINVQTRRVFHMRVSHPSMPEVFLAENLAPKADDSLESSGISPSPTSRIFPQTNWTKEVEKTI